jgi:hypothetical protein
MKATERSRFAVCIENRWYAASLELRKIYRVVPDASATMHHQIRIVDESGEDYLYPQQYFMPIELPQPLEQALLRAGRWRKLKGRQDSQGT